MNKSFFPLVLGVLLASLPYASGSEEVPCAMLLKAGHGAQIIPVKGSVQTRFQTDQPISCGSMVITHEGSVWIRHQNQVVFKLAPNSFFEVGKTKTDVSRFFRGQLLVSGAPSVPMTVVTTPNGQVDFKGGVALISYSPDVKETTVASFNRSFDFRNKFSDQAAQNIRAGEMSRLTLNQDRVVPTQPVVMSPSSVKESLNGFDLVEEEREELAQIVHRVFEDRAKSLTADIEAWDAIAAENAQRSIASVEQTKKKVKERPAIDPEEARFTQDMLKKHLFGDEEDLKMLDEGTRKPASVQKLDDSLYESKKLKKKMETQRLIDEVSELP